MQRLEILQHMRLSFSFAMNFLRTATAKVFGALRAMNRPQCTARIAEWRVGRKLYHFVLCSLAFSVKSTKISQTVKRLAVVAIHYCLLTAVDARLLAIRIALGLKFVPSQNIILFVHFCPARQAESF